MKKICNSFILSGILFFALGAAAYPSSILSISGAVSQALNLTEKDLCSYQTVCVQLNEITHDGRFCGVFNYRGIPLKTLLEIARVEKVNSDFSKPVDLAIVISNKAGEKTVLSWGEVFYKNPGEIIVAISASPVMPHKDCKACHSPEVYEPWLGQLRRKPGFPKLVVAGDIFTDRSLESITDIEVVDVQRKLTVKKSSKLFSSCFTVTVPAEKPITIKKISDYPEKKVTVNVVGEGRGYHGTNTCHGASLRHILEQAGIKTDFNTVFLFSAPDGYRTLLSYGEIFLSAAGERMIIADRVNSEPIENGGKFLLILPGDLMADRWVKAIEKIETIPLFQ